jgi:hypothetical protein
MENRFESLPPRHPLRAPKRVPRIQERIVVTDKRPIDHGRACIIKSVTFAGKFAME